MTKDAANDLGAPDGSVADRKPVYRLWLRNWLLLLTACFALLWIVHRAMVQSITVDEANTFRLWVAPDSPTHWVPHANNHVLNSALMRLFIWLFGLSHLTVRAPALLGGLVYILAIYGFCTLLSTGRVLTWALFVCFVYNPFVMDYLVAARGYSLALGFLSLAVYLLARVLVCLREPGEREILNYAMAISACTALSLCANFSFGWADVFLLVAGAVWLYLEQRKRGMAACARLALAGAFPALAVVFVLAGSALIRFPRDQLIWGTDSLVKTWLDIHAASFAELNHYLVNPLLGHFLHAIQRHIVKAEAAIVILYLVLLPATWQLRRSHARLRLLLAGSLTVVLAFTVLAHWLQFKLLKIPLPLERTSVLFVPLLTAIVGAVLSVAPSNLLERAVRGLGIAALFLTSLYFAGALRDSYFSEFRVCADVRAAFPVILDLCRRAGVREVASDPEFPASLNFYRTLYKATDLDEFPNLDKIPPGKPIYVLQESSAADFIRAEGLQVAYRGSVSNLVVVIRAGAVPSASPNCATGK